MIPLSRPGRGDAAVGSSKGKESKVDSGFSIGDALKSGWEGFKHNIWFFIVALLLAFFIEAIPGGLQAIGYKHPWLAALLGVIFVFCAIVLSMGFINATVRIADGEKARLPDLVSAFPRFWSYLGGSVLYGLIVLAGTILCVIPGIIWGIKYMFYGYFIVDEGLGPMQALKRSGEVTYGNKMNLFLLGVACGLLCFAGALALLVGLFIAIPVSLVAIASVYRVLAEDFARAPAGEALGQPQEAPPVPPRA